MTKTKPAKGKDKGKGNPTKKLPTKKLPANKSPGARRMSAAEIEAAFSRLSQANPEPKTELNYTNPYTLLVAVVLSAQATDTGVNRATGALFKSVDTPQKMIALGEAGLKEHIKTIGLYNTKAKNVIRLSELLLERFGGEVPADRETLEALPGVGRKTANVVLNIWFHLPAQAVDTHIFRLGNRSGIAPGRDEAAVERAIEDNVPAEFQQHAHHWLILHGRYICTARKPKCGLCPIRDDCLFQEKTA